MMLSSIILYFFKADNSDNKAPLSASVA